MAKHTGKLLCLGLASGRPIWLSRTFPLLWKRLAVCGEARILVAGAYPGSAPGCTRCNDWSIGPYPFVGVLIVFASKAHSNPVHFRKLRQLVWARARSLKISHLLVLLMWVPPMLPYLWLIGSPGIALGPTANRANTAFYDDLH